MKSVRALSLKGQRYSIWSSCQGPLSAAVQQIYFFFLIQKHWSENFTCENFTWIAKPVQNSQKGRVVAGQEVIQGPLQIGAGSIYTWKYLPLSWDTALIPAWHSHCFLALDLPGISIEKWLEKEIAAPPVSVGEQCTSFLVCVALV